MAAEGFGGRPTTSRGRRHRMQWARRRLRLWDALTRIAAGAGLELGAHAARRGAAETGADLYRRVGISDSAQRWSNTNRRR